MNDFTLSKRPVSWIAFFFSLINIEFPKIPPSHYLCWIFCRIFNFTFSVTSAIMCYECNSQYDPRCGDNFDPYSLALVNCSLKEPPNHLRDLEPVLCRKITQKGKWKSLLWHIRTSRVYEWKFLILSAENQIMFSLKLRFNLSLFLW